MPNMLEYMQQGQKIDTDWSELRNVSVWWVVVGGLGVVGVQIGNMAIGN